MSINKYDWQQIETFDEKVGWQVSLLYEVYNISRSFARRFGKEEEEEEEDDNGRIYRWNYKDDTVEIKHYVRLHNNGRTGSDVSINLGSLGTNVFSVYFYGINHSQRSISCFRIGSWLNHIESLRLKLEPIEKAEEKKRKEQEAREREEKFERLD